MSFGRPDSIPEARDGNDLEQARKETAGEEGHHDHTGDVDNKSEGMIREDPPVEQEYGNPNDRHSKYIRELKGKDELSRCTELRKFQKQGSYFKTHLKIGT